MIKRTRTWICLVGDFLRILPWQITIVHHHLGEYLFMLSNHLKQIFLKIFPESITQRKR